MTLLARSPLGRLVALALALLVSFSVVAPAAAETVPVTINIQAGALALTIPQNASVTFAGQNNAALTYGPTAQSASGSFSFTVDDGRLGTAGWNVTASMSQLSGPNNAAIAASNVSFSTSNIAKVAGSDNTPQAGQNATLDQSRKVLVANGGQGAGRYTATLNLNLNVPAYTRPGEYSGTLTISIVAGP
jgi:hypothetical protein